MTYAIILKDPEKGDSYLLGFTDTPISETYHGSGLVKYTVELSPLTGLFVPLTGSAAVYLR